MEISEKEIKLTTEGSEWLLKNINIYISNSFGSKNKNDFEVLIFNALLLDGNFRKKSNFAKAKELGISEAKVKRLNYEADLKFKRKEEDLYNELISALKSVTVKGNTNLLQFVIADKYLRGYLDDKLKTNNRFSDSSFNSEIVTIDFKDLLVIYREFNQGKNDLAEIMKTAYECLTPDITPEILFDNLLGCLQNSKSLIGASLSVTSMGIKTLIAKVNKKNFLALLENNKRDNIKL